MLQTSTPTAYSAQRQQSRKEVYWIQPERPTALGDLSVLPMPPTDTLFYDVYPTWVVPGPLDPARLRSALSKTLRDFAHATGRIMWNQEQSIWQIDLSANQGVPLVFDVSHTRYGILDAEYDHQRDAIVVDEVPIRSADANVSKLYDAAVIRHHSKNTYLKAFIGVPLIRFKVIYWTASGDTSVHLAFCHALGDGYTVAKLMKSFSDYYEGCVPFFKPTFDKFLTADPPESILSIAERMDLERASSHMLEGVCEVEDALRRMIEAGQTTVPITLRLTPDNLAAAYHIAKTTVSAEWKREHVTPMNAIPAYLVYALNSVSDAPALKKIDHVVSIRTRKPAHAKSCQYISPLLTSVGNGIVEVTEHFEDGASVGDMAAAMRLSALALRKDPDRVAAIMALRSHNRKRAAAERKVIVFPPTETYSGSNILAQLGLRDAHFGYPDHVRLHMYNIFGKNRFTIFDQNPIKLPDDKTWLPAPKGVDVNISIAPEYRNAFLAKVEHDLGPGQGDAQALAKL